MALKAILSPRAKGGLIGAALTVGLGLGLYVFKIGDGLTAASFDLPFAFRADIKTEEAVIVYMDDASHKELGQSFLRAWDRGLHAQLLERITSAGAKTVVMDILFTDEDTNNPAADERLMRAMRAHGKVVLASASVTPRGAVVVGEQIQLPHAKFRTNAVAHGVANKEVEPPVFVRRHYSKSEAQASLAWAAAEAVGARVTKRPRQWFLDRWLNYYGPPGWVPSVSYHLALQAGGIPDDFFRDKTVFVGRRTSAEFAGAEREDFATPYTRWTQEYASGVELHATAFLNLARGDWLSRMPAAGEVALLIVLGAVFGYGLTQLRPVWGVGASLVGACLIAAVAHLVVWRTHTWFAWLIPVAAQLPTALVSSIIYNSIQAYVEKRVLMESLAMYVSIPRARQLLRKPDLLQPGAEQQEISILFSDISNFSTITERMVPRDLMRLLNDYFEVAIGCIHEPDGTVMKLIGDGIFAIWNAPEAQPGHQERACRAALLLRQMLVEFDTTHKGRLPLRTRVGLHTGVAYVGNFGSAKRFDYTAIGDSINLASRLEGLNKHLGTEILASREILAEVEKLFVTRWVGHYKLKGFDRVVEVYELIGTTESEKETRAWRGAFEDALHLFHRADFPAAEKAFQRVLELRAEDGPSKFYLRQIADRRVCPPAPDWEGEIDMKEK
jgi:adenylate cyclase